MTERSRDFMSDEIRSIRIESNNICYGSEPGADDKVVYWYTKLVAPWTDNML